MGGKNEMGINTEKIKAGSLKKKQCKGSNMLLFGEQLNPEANRFHT
jgi:hypothetical protein